MLSPIINSPRRTFKNTCTTEAVAELQKAVQLSGGSPTCIANLARAYVVSGKRSEALKLLGDLKKRSNPGYSNASEIAMIYASLGDTDQAMNWLEKGYEERFNPGVLLRPGFDPLRSDSALPKPCAPHWPTRVSSAFFVQPRISESGASSLFPTITRCSAKARRPRINPEREPPLVGFGLGRMVHVVPSKMLDQSHTVPRAVRRQERARGRFRPHNLSLSANDNPLTIT